MSKVLITDTYLSNIADAIRNKNGSSATYKPSTMASAINALSTSGESSGISYQYATGSFSIDASNSTTTIGTDELPFVPDIIVFDEYDYEQFSFIPALFFNEDSSISTLWIGYAADNKGYFYYNGYYSDSMLTLQILKRDWSLNQISIDEATINWYAYKLS